MKYLTIVLTIALSIHAFAKADAQNKKMDRFEIQVDGLGCPFCAYGLEKKFKEFKGIKDVAIVIETGDFSFAYPAEKALTMDQVTAQVVKAGYTPNLATITRADGTIETNGTEKVALTEENITSSEIYVHGKCGMCKARIEKAARDVQGVATAIWDVETSVLNLSYDPTIISTTAVENAVAKAGHDTKSVRTDDATYESLPACCHYKRAE